MRSPLWCLLLILNKGTVWSLINYIHKYNIYLEVSPFDVMYFIINKGNLENETCHAAVGLFTKRVGKWKRYVNQIYSDEKFLICKFITNLLPAADFGFH